ncbi:transcription termination factor MTERF8, chloroplastic-like [Gastrolobium bilobum]|uniref:transcription termination factor MTERF8, chloroplastic-like n=1 Tax=Gastrolobium bilobum TaxID=150636 RepID=UPI002AB1CA3E|nr:transcription termination factor MTERF8, chloroplastic-like [Gastrolobium bilobum]XP_061342803.1 transcription termination factor MTERF8, chloroplastic-like [Gastrolobium bilobum]XP_061342804.1 transcription termination factor MTERF8, chloroplastic-like [Gastrolobium bilobum]
MKKMMHYFLISRFASSFPIPNRSQLNLVRQNAFLFFTAPASFSEPKRNQLKYDNFTVSYLITSCGLPPETAARVSSNVRLKTLDKSNAVLNLLKNFGFSKNQIAKCVQKIPSLLNVNAEKTLLPKFKFFRSIGVSNIDFPEFIIDNPTVLSRSLNKCLIPRYKVLRSVVRSDEEVVGALKRRALWYKDLMNDLVPNISVLRESGVPQASISHLVMFNPFTAYKEHSKFVEAVKLAKEMGVDPLKTIFVSAIRVLISLDNAQWESRLEVYKKWGWSREITLSVFRKYPTIMSYTEERITKSMNFLVKDMGWPPEDIARFPAALAYNFEKRIVPRCAVIKILQSKRLRRNSLGLASFMAVSEENFLKTFVTEFLDDVPLLLDVYRGLIDHQDVL